MFTDRFDKLCERLLRAGIAPRHVRRYVTELRDHFDDLVREGTESELRREAAEQAAHSRIGSDDDLSSVMLARPGLRSVTARFPWVAFGFGPVLMLVVVIYTALLIQVGLFVWSPAIPQWSIPWGKRSFDALNWVATYAAPLLIAAVLVIIGVRQRVTTGWIVLGLAVICVVGGFHEIGVKWSSVPSQPNELYMRFAIWFDGEARPFPGNMIVSGLLRAVINAAIVGGAYWLWTRTRSYGAASSTPWAT